MAARQVPQDAASSVAAGEKPELVLREAVNDDVEIVRNAHTCLVFTDPLRSSFARRAGPLPFTDSR
ncbi:hypothetical protein ACF1B0_35515 [Streptomyces anandii]|uniref:hypothetical protein n=1 Tax=Streptomyces anandii TaxID=285454 RepID=UPI0036FBCE9E